MGKSTISMAIFNSYVKLPEGSRKSTQSTNKRGINGWLVGATYPSEKIFQTTNQMVIPTKNGCIYPINPLYPQLLPSDKLTYLWKIIISIFYGHFQVRKL